MVKLQYKGSPGHTKHLKAKEVHALTMETLHTYFPLDRENKKLEVPA
jgi:hypothetical protein